MARSRGSLTEVERGGEEWDQGRAVVVRGRRLECG
jgi:hypothetical protein